MSPNVSARASLGLPRRGGKRVGEHRISHQSVLATGATMAKIGAVLATGDPDAEPEVVEHGVLMIRHGAPELTLT